MALVSPSKMLLSALVSIGRFLIFLLRPHTLGVQGLVVDEEGRVLLVEHTYRSGWHLPGGGVKRGESLEQAVRRELEEEVSVKVGEGKLKLLGVYSNNARFCNDHIVVYEIRAWTRATDWSSNFEIESAEFFPLEDLPGTASRSAARRVEEFLGKRDITGVW